MKLDNVGDVIATRILLIEEADGSERTVIVRIGRPQMFSESPDDCFVPYQIVGLGSERVRYGAGVDSVQALQLVMKMIGADLAALNREYVGAMRWEAGQNENDFGFPDTP
jgi:hypothetical protein